METKEAVIYLGARITNKGGSEGEVTRRIGIAKGALTKLTKIWKDHVMSIRTKKRLIQSSSSQSPRTERGLGQ